MWFTARGSGSDSGSDIGKKKKKKRKGGSGSDSDDNVNGKDHHLSAWSMIGTSSALNTVFMKSIFFYILSSRIDVFFSFKRLRNFWTILKC